ncbi:MAG: hypothetical protein SGJ07_13935 [Rhodospirillaceae bacterium]|nr:hypothetical protein [Rhodospirillaceae bacterium]
MIIFLATTPHLYTMRDFVEDNHDRLGGRIRLVGYSTLFKASAAPVASYIFADLERLTLQGMERAARAWQQLCEADPRIRLFNDPRQVKRRYELLRHLYTERINSFNIYRANDALPDCRYPVFLRREDDHSGPSTALIRDAIALRSAIDALPGQGRFRDNHVITEFCGAPDDTGAYVKYGCFRVGDAIMPQNRLVGRQWCVKKFEYFDETVVARDLAYVRSDEHNKAVRRVFDTAQVEYGRVDYSIVDGRLEFYELNTNPHNSYREMDAIPDSKSYFTPRFIDALLALDCDADPAERVKLTAKARQPA